jgi:hypothetical protein
VTSGATALQLVIRPARPDDIPGCVELQAEAWERTSRASEAQLQRRLELHPHGFFVALNGERVCGSLTTIRLSTYPFDDPPDWYTTTGSGWGDTHEPTGTILHGIDLSTARQAPREAARRLVEAALEYAVRENLRSVVAGLRIARFRKWASVMTAEEYVAGRRPSGNPLDPLLARILHYPSVAVVKVVPRYFSDSDSHDFGVVVRWDNPYYEAPQAPGV